MFEDNKDPINIERWTVRNPWTVTVKQLKKWMPGNIRAKVDTEDKTVEDFTVVATEQ